MPRHLVLFVVACLTVSSASSDDGFLIRINAAKQVEVVPLRTLAEDRRGLAVWSRGEDERWAVLPTAPDAAANTTAKNLKMALSGAARGAATTGVASGPGMTTFQPDQLLGLVVVRAGKTGFLTPADQSFLLNSQPTLRRRPAPGETDKTKYPAAEAVLLDENRELLRISFAAGQASLRWSEIPKLPAALKNGLPAGAYTLRTIDGPVTTFQVEEPETRDWIMQPLQQLRDSLASNDLLYVAAAVPHLLGQRDEHDKPRAYTTDALDLLDGVPPTTAPKWIDTVRQRLLRRLAGEPEAAVANPLNTGIASIDQARDLIQSGQWNTALRLLDDPASLESPRAKSLALLYRAVIGAESGLVTGDAPDQMFLAAIDGLRDAPPADRFRAHNNFGGVLFARARDRVHNHAFQMASGVPFPLLSALADWSAAERQFQLALQHSSGLDPSLAAGVRINLAHLYTLLAELIRVLDYDVGSRRFAEGETAALAQASEFASAVLGPESRQLDAVARGAAHEVLAQLAFRKHDGATCQQHANQARAAYLEASSLAGLESVERLLGLQLASTKQSDDALQHLLISHQLTELLRARIPAEQTGLSRAGFFARRSYVYERIIELLIARRDDARALSFAEAAKARALQDLLVVRGLGGRHRDDEARTTSELLAEWPREVAAIEYFLGTERSWVFVVSRTGTVRAHGLVDANGQPIRSRELVERVQQFLAGIGSQATKLHRAASSGRGFDQSWQDDLHAFQRLLLPPPVLTDMRAAKTVVVVPHHVLHYFPFAALVTERDPVARGKFEVPQPKFLVEEPFHLCRAPSLTTWDWLRQKPRAVSGVQAVGIAEFPSAPALPGVEQDLANLKGVFGSRLRQVVDGPKASEAAIKNLLKQPGLLFLGTHGTNVAEQPLASYLLCHADAKDDGRLTAGEIFGSDIAADLVVMSACYSGLADQSPLPGDDLFGLERAFLNSGATTVVSGLWDVYDSTGPMLMNDFFKQLVAKQSAAESLANAQRAFLAERRKEGPSDPWIHPYFWSVYTLSGSDRTALDK